MASIFVIGRVCASTNALHQILVPFQVRILSCSSFSRTRRDLSNHHIAFDRTIILIKDDFILIYRWRIIIFL